MLQTTALACERGGLRLFGAVSFTLEGGALLRLRGRNGTGKTSLLRILAGLSRPAEGDVRWKGTPIAELAEDYGRDLLYIGHAPGLKDEMTVLENLEFHARVHGHAPDEAALRGALARVGIARLADLPARYLSQGQRRRAALARLPLSAAQRLWLLDEPFVALDDEAIDHVRELVEAHLGAGGMVVLTSHQEVAIGAGMARDLELENAA